MPKTVGPTVFMSHSHRDRDEALRLQKLLEINNARTFLDQEEIRAGDDLPRHIKKGIASCDAFLLIWSIHGGRSEWVKREWEAAYNLKKRIISYVVDSTPLPDALRNFVYIGQTDQEHGNAELLRAVFGSLPWELKGADMFPGHWEAEVEFPDGTGNQVLVDLELRSNGQVTGQVQVKPVGTLGWVRGEASRALGIDVGFVFQPYPLRGSWSYKPGSGLRLDFVSSAFGQEVPQTMQVNTAVKRQGVLQGTGPGGSQWTLRRKDR